MKQVLYAHSWITGFGRAAIVQGAAAEKENSYLVTFVENEGADIDSVALPSPKKGSALMRGILIGIAISALVMALAYYVVAPRLVAGRVSGLVDMAAAQSVDCVLKPGAGSHADAAPPTVHQVANIVANPAGASGVLLITIGLEVASEDEAHLLEAAEPAIRDGVVRLVRTRSAESLRVAGAEEALAADVRKIVADAAPNAHVKRILFPQFLLQ